ncbi:MAG: nucleotidyltransferase [Thermoplasmata archaeon]|nr:MAG: nucleotidyltransferase [Thermoplasmata archaeon]
MRPNIRIPKKKISDFCRKHHIRKLSLFGSVLRDDFGSESDVDCLVEFEEGHTPGFFRLYEMEEELSLILGGRRADIKTIEDLSKHFRDDVLRNSEVQYAS